MYIELKNRNFLNIIFERNSGCRGVKPVGREVSKQRAQTDHSEQMCPARPARAQELSA